jgi:hypothetical protein
VAVALCHLAHAPLHQRVAASAVSAASGGGAR